jgi:hypothetical protein
MHEQQPKQHLRAKALCVQLLATLVSIKTALATAATATTATTLLIQHNLIRSMQVNSEQLHRAFKAQVRVYEFFRLSLVARTSQLWPAQLIFSFLFFLLLFFLSFSKKKEKIKIKFWRTGKAMVRNHDSAMPCACCMAVHVAWQCVN